MSRPGHGARLWFVSGAPGAGKTAIVAQLAARANGRFVALDMDEILNDQGELLGLPIASETGAEHWPAYNALWLRLAGLITRSNVPVILFGPLLPSEMGDASLDGGIDFLLLDCPDEARVVRLTRRGWSEAQIADALDDAAAARDEIQRRISTDASIEDCVSELFGWVTVL